ncbi:thioredoxin-like protein [Mariannaea sp. PMI_226]|nr:thioredoxin-like protein [Mariannaea sp. PMI_226]
MSSLASQLSAVAENLNQVAPASAISAFNKSIADLEASFDTEYSTIKVGDTMPGFSLSNALDKEITSESLLAKGPILITFYRGEWCPYCNLALHSLQKHIDDFQAKGVTLIAISPELPNQSLTTTEKMSLKFEVLSDVGNKFAKQLGILWKQPESLRPIFGDFGLDLEARNGDDSFELPIPTTLLVDKEGIVRNIYVEPDYRKRLEPSTALEWVNSM